MEHKTKIFRLEMKKLLVFVISLSLCYGKILKYDLVNDDRKQFTLSTFGFLQKGTLDVKITGFSYKFPSGISPKTPVFGFTLDKSKTKEVSSYIENMEDSCILNKSQAPADKSVSMVFFIIDQVHKELIVKHRQGDKVSSLLLITETDRDTYLDNNNLHRRDTSAVKNSQIVNSLSDKSLLHRQKRRAAGDAPTTASATTSAPSAATSAPSNSNHTAGKSTLKLAPNDTLVFKMNETDGVLTGHFLVAIKTKQEEGLYNLFFHNCYNYDHKAKSMVNLSLEITEDNNGNFLSAGQMPEPALYFTFSLIFFIAACLWLGVIKKSEVYKIHFLMLAVVFVKSLSSAFHGVNSYFIEVTGIHEETWAILYYIVYLFRGALMFVTILLIGAGWAFIKHMLSHKEKKLFLIVLPLQVLDQVAWVIVEESEEGQVLYTTWKEIFILFDLLCCGAILFPVVWSIRHLQEASRTDGKAAMNLNKLKLFRQFYILIVCFIYFTRIIVYLLKITLPFKLEWLTELFKELATLIFFVVTGYKFRPASDNPYLQVPQESDDEIEMEEVLTQTGLMDSVVKVNQRYEEKTESTEPLIKQRESSHEYD
ncbi:protein GPR107-like [Haliotis rufescens]|uniref:protein GPR107-like n=1 Tax=Haliotis rufescens TaxID=6454 RepID=UPI001EB0AA20|nr:protein GPR107-like [Haliotis rufescens]